MMGCDMVWDDVMYGCGCGGARARETTEIDVDASWPRAYCLRICMYVCMYVRARRRGGTKHPRLKYLADRARDDGD